MGLRNPRNTYIKEKNVNKAIMKQQLEFEIEANDEYVSMSMMDPYCLNVEGVNNSKVRFLLVLARMLGKLVQYSNMMGLEELDIG